MIRRLLLLYPRDWRARYGDEFAALLEELPLTPLALLDVLLGALDARLTPGLAPGSVVSMTNKLRTSAVTIFYAFALFVFAYLGFQRLTDPRPPFDAVANAHPPVRVAFAVFEDAAALAAVAVIAGGLPIVYAVVRSALVARRRDVLTLLGLPALGVALSAGTLPLVALVFRGVTPQTKVLTPAQIVVELGWLALVGCTFLGGTVAVALAVTRTEIGARALRFATWPATAAVAAMAVSFAGLLAWGALLWSADPQIYGGVLGDCASTECYGAIGDIGVGGLAFVAVLMAVAVAVAAFALRRAYAAQSGVSSVA